MTKRVFGLDTQPGIQRDGTVTDRNLYNDGQWVRFQRKRPRKILGYREISNQIAGPSRGLYLDPENQYSNILSGYSAGLQSTQINYNGIGSGVYNYSLSSFTPNANNLWQFDGAYDSFGGTGVILAHPGQNLTSINSQVNTPVLYGSQGSYSMSQIGIFTATGSTNSTNVITLSNTNLLVGAGQTITDSLGKIPAGTTVVSVVGTTVTISNSATGTVSGDTFTFNNNVSVSGGVCVLHPYVFVYGNNGLIRNSGSNGINDWVSADSNTNNVASNKIVKGLPIRGGSNAPSGLFWSLDSLIRVSYSPTTVSVGGSTISYFWRYDIITSQSSILSSQCVIEYDGIYYWIGVDRFLAYNGVVKEIPNETNQNYFFDNLNYAQAQKVYATKVPRYGEIWWFYPRGDSTECNDAIIYNVREGVWYDAGTALGARRSAGYFSELFPYPVNVDWEPNLVNAVITGTITNAGSGYTNGVYANTPLTGVTTTDPAIAVITVSGGVVTKVDLQYGGQNYAVGNVLSATLPGGSGFQFTVTSASNTVSMFQHEVGTDAVIGGELIAIPSFFETNNLGWVSGGPAGASLMGENFWIRLERVEPDFVLDGTMDLYITGRPYAQESDLTTGPYTFDSTTGKIDMKEQRREMRLRFVSNVIGGNYQLGYTILNADIGDVRGY